MPDSLQQDTAKPHVSGANSNRRRSRSLALKIAFSCFTMFGVVVGIEAMSYLYVRFSHPDDFKLFEHCLFKSDRNSTFHRDHRGKLLAKPAIPFKHFRQMGYNANGMFWGLNVNQNGFIANSNGDEEIPPIKDRMETRIVILGGSTVAGTGASSNEKTIAAVLERELQFFSQGKVRVINAGVGGYYSPHQFSYLIHVLIPEYTPDAVIVLDGFNDSRHSYRTDAEYTSGDLASSEAFIGNMLDGRYGVLSMIANKYPIHDPTRYFTHLAFKLARNGSQIDNPPVKSGLILAEVKQIPLPEEELPEINIDPYLYYTNATLSLAESSGIRLLHVLQPSVVYKQELTKEEEALLAWAEQSTRSGQDPYNHDSFIRQVTRFFDAARDELQTLREAHSGGGVKMLDLSKHFEDHVEDIFYDYCHYTDLGNELIAGQIADQAGEFLCRQRIDKNDSVEPAPVPHTALGR